MGIETAPAHSPLRVVANNGPVRRRLALPLATLAVAGSLIGGEVGATSGARAAAGNVREDAIHSEALQGTLRFAVWLPPGYPTHPHRRYPVLYVLHGLPAGEHAYRSLLFLAPVLDRLRARALVVFPQGARPGESDDEYLDLGPGRDWARALTRELPAAVASRYRALGTRAARGIIGISAGGYGAVILGLHNLDRYRLIESWSGYFHATAPDGRSPMALPPRLTEWARREQPDLPPSSEAQPESDAPRVLYGQPRPLSRLRDGERALRPGAPRRRNPTPVRSLSGRSQHRSVACSRRRVVAPRAPRHRRAPLSASPFHPPLRREGEDLPRL